MKIVLHLDRPRWCIKGRRAERVLYKELKRHWERVEHERKWKEQREAWAAFFKARVEQRKKQREQQEQ